MNDRELLEKAAKAAGWVSWDWLAAPMLNVYDANGRHDLFNPLTDDGDALRLAVQLRMRVDSWGVGAGAVVIIDNRAQVAEPHYGDDPGRATRRAIVRAAAAIGESM